MRYLILLCVVAACGPDGSALPRDRDADGISDGHDACPDVPENNNDFEDLDGCPDVIPAPPPPSPVDSDGDGIPDSSDACPSQPETKNGYLDSDGCPDSVPAPVDTDHDGIPDANDACPTGAEVVNGYQDTDGCPDVNPRFAGRWAGPVTIQLQGEAPFQYSGVVNGSANGFQAIFSPVCPGGDGTMATTVYTDQYSVSWNGALTCAPVALSGCSFVVFTFTGSAFSLNAATGNLGAAGGGSVSGCGITKGFTMVFSGLRQ